MSALGGNHGDSEYGRNWRSEMNIFKIHCVEFSKKLVDILFNITFSF